MTSSGEKELCESYATVRPQRTWQSQQLLLLSQSISNLKALKLQRKVTEKKAFQEPAISSLLVHDFTSLYPAPYPDQGQEGRGRKKGTE